MNDREEESMPDWLVILIVIGMAGLITLSIMVFSARHGFIS